MSKLVIRISALLGLLVGIASQARADVIVFDNMNGDHVVNQTQTNLAPLNPTFTLSQATYITTVDIYHWGDQTLSDTISIAQIGGATISAAVTGFPDYGCCQHFIATFNQILNAGTYIVLDARSEWWSYNAQTGNVGMTTVYSGTAPVSTPEPATLAFFGLAVPAVIALRRRRHSAPPA